VPERRLIVETGDRPAAELDDGRRRNWRITTCGQAVARGGDFARKNA
jgi:hypothetical protein